MSEKDISFKPLSDGLGFHPFADGLPYAPVVKQAPTQRPLAAALNPNTRDPMAMNLPKAPLAAPSTPMGTGAVAAGRAVPVKPGQGPVAAPAARVTTAPPARGARAPQSQPARISVPVATVAGISSAAAPRVAESVARVAGSIQPGATASGEEPLPPRVPYSYMFKRFFAFLIDASVNTGLCVLALGAVMVRLDLGWDAFSNANLLIMGVLFLALFNWSIMTAQEVILGTTLGKRIFGLVLRADTSALFLRAFFFVPSLVFCCLGIVWAVFDRRKRCWHDHVVDVQPLEIATL